MQQVSLNTLRDDEVLVQMLASGICHTDLVMTSVPDGQMGINYPKVTGHEGAGIVKAKGAKVTKKLDVGDPVLLSFAFCTKCPQCETGHPAYCDTFNPLNMTGIGDSFKQGEGGKDVAGSFFGQSSFASLTAVKEASVVNVKGLVKDEEELKLLGKLGHFRDLTSASPFH